MGNEGMFDFEKNKNLIRLILGISVLIFHICFLCYDKSNLAVCIVFNSLMIFLAVMLFFVILSIHLLEKSIKNKKDAVKSSKFIQLLFVGIIGGLVAGMLVQLKNEDNIFMYFSIFVFVLFTIAISNYISNRVF